MFYMCHYYWMIGVWCNHAVNKAYVV